MLLSNIKYLSGLFFFLILQNVLFAQDGPGGIGSADGTSNLVIWLDANTLGLSNNADVTNWIDQSGYNHHATTSSPTWSAGNGVDNNIDPPTYDLNEPSVNGMPSVKFDRSNTQWLEIVPTANIRPNKNLSIFGVFESSGQDGVDYGTVLNYSTKYAKDDNGYIFGMSTPGNTFSYGADGWKWNDDNKGHYYLSGTVQAENAPHIVGMTSDGINSALYEDDISATQSGNGGDNNNIQYPAPDASGSANLTIGAYMGQWNGSNDYLWDGYMSEIIMFKKELSKAERYILMNYLAAKYGQNLSGNEDEVYDQDNNGAGNYDFDVAGIGRINSSDIHNESRGTGIVTIASTNGLTQNNSFLMWGHDNNELSYTESIDVPSGVTSRLQRVWSVSEENTSNAPVNVGNIDLTFDLSALGTLNLNQIKLLVDADGVFTNATIIANPIDLGGNQFKFTNISNVTNNSYFTLAIGNAPGGVSTNLNLWLRADIGTIGSPTVTTWSNQGPKGVSFDANTTGGTPRLINSGRNYNPIIRLDGTNEYLSGNLNIQTNFNSVLIVSKMSTYANTGENNEGMFSVLSSGEVSSNNNTQSLTFLKRKGATNHINSYGNSTNYAQATNKIDDKFHVYTNKMNGSAIELFVENKSYGSVSHTQNMSAEKYYLGAQYTGGGISDWMKGEFGEVIQYNKKLSTIEQRKVESYLAIKYSITLDKTGGGASGDYIAPDGSILWDASQSSLYHNDIIGIGREDIEGLLQKQSKTNDDTTIIYIGSLSSSSSLNTSVIASDVSYIIIGNNKGELNSSPSANIEIPPSCGINSRIEREWKVTRTLIAKKFNLDLKLNAAANPGSVNVNHLRLLIDDDGDFSNGGTSCYSNGDGSGVVISYSNPTIKIANISNVMVPNNSSSYLTIASTNSSSPLPVELIDFNIKCLTNQPELEWSTISELNNDYFTIERGRDGIYFENITTIKGNVNTQSLTSYLWKDDYYINQLVYYRLSQTDVDGKRVYLGIKSISCGVGENILLYPNPFKTNFELQLPESFIYPFNIELHDYMGRKVHSQVINNNNSIVFVDQKIKPGTYFVRFFDAYTPPFFKRIIKVK